MKIFSWVHRRFNNKAENVNKYGDVSKFPAESKCGDDEAYERWGGGILTIGTFGYDPLKKDESDHKYDINDYFSSSEEEDGDGDGAGGEENDDEVVAAAEMEMEESWSDEEVQAQLGYEYMMMKKTERTTLADLFRADCKEKRGSVSKKEAAAAVEKPAAAAAEMVKGKSNRKSFGKKLIAKDARPIQKLNKLMRRMLKRKIHPDVGPAGSKVAAAVNDNININSNNNNNSRATDDYASLLPTTTATDTNI